MKSYDQLKKIINFFKHLEMIFNVSEGPKMLKMFINIYINASYEFI